MTVEPLSDGSWGVFKGGEQIGAMSDKDVKPLEPGSVDMPPLISGRNIDKALKDFDPKEPGVGPHQLGGTEFFPRTGDFEADEQIRSYEDSHLKNVNQLLDAPASSFMEGPILHNLAATEDAGEKAAEGLSDVRSSLEKLYGEGIGDPTMDQRMTEVAGTLSTLTETGEAVQRLGQGLARNGDAYNSISSSLAAGVQDGFSQIKAYAEKHDRWESSGSSAAEPRPNFDFITSELEEAVGDVRDTLEGTISAETMLASATLDPPPVTTTQVGMKAVHPGGSACRWRDTRSRPPHLLADPPRSRAAAPPPLPPRHPGPLRRAAARAVAPPARPRRSWQV
ncbi:MAG: hypothetical protein ACI38U_14595 [Corynebacterium sp.]|uniref:hypothetical protein n=1 Tax=unclassified Corynebacterium TaxID=2624378 RepID=UPI00111512C2|nr:hypothetical protein [Corynebacterium sp. CNJ-954]